jgi:hypothetical protein
MRGIVVFTGGLAVWALAACGGGREENAAPGASRAQTRIALERRIDRASPAMFVVDVEALRRATRLDPGADFAAHSRARTLASAALPYLTVGGAVSEAIDHRRVTRAIAGIDASVIATTQPFEEVERALVARGGRKTGRLVLGFGRDPYAVGSAGDGTLIVGFRAAAVRQAQERTDGGVPPKLAPLLESLDTPVRAAAVPAAGTECVAAVGIGAGRGSEARLLLEMADRPSRGRVRLERFERTRYELGTATVEGSRLSVPLRWKQAAPTELLAGDFIAEEFYRC